MLEEFVFDDRDFALADQNEIRKIWAEKYLEMRPSAAEAEHFSLYKASKLALTEKLKNQAPHTLYCPRTL